MNLEDERATARKLSSVAKPSTAIILGTGLDIMEDEIAIEESLD